MASYKPTMPFDIPARILKCEYKKVNGINTKRFVEHDTLWVSARSYGGTERIIDDKVVIEDTVNLETWYRTDITAKDHIRLLDDDSEWEIIDNPDNISRRNQYLKFKCRRVKGGA